jgi:hypothetical protein
LEPTPFPQRVGPYDDTKAYYLVIISDGQKPYLHRCDSLPKLIEMLMNLAHTDTYVFPYYGYPLFITTKPNQHLLAPDGKTYPLESNLPQITINENGDLSTSNDR